MNAHPDQPHQSPEGNSDKPKKPGKSVAQTAAEHKKSISLEQSHRTEEAASKAEAEIAENIELPWDYLGFAPKNEATKNQLVDALLIMQTKKQRDNPEYKVADTPTKDVGELRQELLDTGFTPISETGGTEKPKPADSEVADSNLDKSTESPEQRKARLSNFVTTNFPDCPPEHLDAATNSCTSYEDENRELFEDPEFRVSEEDVADLQPEMVKLIGAEKNDETIATNAKAIQAAEKNVAAKAETVKREEAGDKQDKAKIKTEKAKTPKLKEEVDGAENRLDEELSEEALKKKDQETIQKNYDRLRGEKGQVAALQELIGMVKSPEVKQRLQGIISTIGRLKNVVPGKQAQLDEILNSTPLALNSGSVIGAFSPFLPKLHASPHFTEEEKHAIHAALHHHPKTSMDAQAALRQGCGYETDPETGEKIPLKYDKDHPLELEGGGQLYEEPDGSVVVQVGDWKKEIEGGIRPSDLTRWVSFGKDQQEFQTAGVENFMGYRFGIHEPDKYLKKFQNIKNSVLGGARGLEGTYASHNDSHRYMHIVKFMSSFGESPVKVNENTMVKSMKGIGLPPKGILEADSAVLKEIGAFFQETPTAHGEEAYKALQKRLINKGLIDPNLANTDE